MSEHVPDFQHLIDHQLWLLRETMTTTERPANDLGNLCAPARWQLPHLHAALAKWALATKETHALIPDATTRKVADTRRLGTVSSVAEMAAIDPATRRYYLLDMVLYLMREAVDLLEQEGQPPPPTPDLRLGKMRRSS